MHRPAAAAAFLIAAQLFAPAAFAQTPILERTATSSVKVWQDKDGWAVVTTTSRRFSVAELFQAPDTREALLLLEEFWSERRPGMEGQNGVVRVEAWLGLQPPKKRWSIEQEGDAGRVIGDDFYKVTRYGCCASLTTDVYFNLRTGEKTFTATHGRLGEVIVPNTGVVRYVAYHSAGGSIPPEDEGKRGGLLGVVQYGTRDKVTLKLAVRSRIDAGGRIKFAYRDKVTESEELMLWGADGRRDKSSLSDFAVIISYGRAGDIVLPVRNDEIDLGRATVPSGFTLEVLK